jgi:hypothetical protein
VSLRRANPPRKAGLDLLRTRMNPKQVETAQRLVAAAS